LAFQALAIFALALPGIILKNTYRNGFFWDRPRQDVQITEEVAYSLVLACCLHAVFVPIVSRFFWPIDLQAVVALLLGQFGKDSQLLGRAIASVTAHPDRVFAYFVSLYAVSGALGYGAHGIVRALHLDRHTRFLRFDHRWHYLLRGEIAEFPESDVEVPETFDAISIACIADTAAGTFLYVGVLDAFYFNKAGDLDLLVLSGAFRRLVDPLREQTVDQQPEYYFIDADYLYLKYDELRNVSIRYAILPSDEEQVA